MSQQKTYKMKILPKLRIINENLIQLIQQRGASRKLSTFAMKAQAHCKENEIRSNIAIKQNLYLLILFYYQQEGNTEKLFRPNLTDAIIILSRRTSVIFAFTQRAAQ